MTITIPADPLLDLLGRDGEHWLKGSWGNDKVMCLHGAIRRCAPQPGDAHIVEQVARRMGWGPSWNDADDTTWADVRARINGGIDVTDEMLADTFGPQWEPILALVRRAAVLTDDEGRALAAAWAAARDAARDAGWAAAARDAAWAAAWDAAWDAALDAGWAAARDAGWAAARDAAWALVARDLIGQSGFTQSHYDTLTRPWATVIGPVHPDDKPVKP